MHHVRKALAIWESAHVRNFLLPSYKRRARNHSQLPKKRVRISCLVESKGKKVCILVRTFEEFP